MHIKDALMYDSAYLIVCGKVKEYVEDCVCATSHSNHRVASFNIENSNGYHHPSEVIGSAFIWNRTDREDLWTDIHAILRAYQSHKDCISILAELNLVGTEGLKDVILSAIPVKYRTKANIENLFKIFEAWL